MSAWVVGWMGRSVGQRVGSGDIIKYQINIDLFEIIQFSLKIYDLLRHPYLWMDVLVVGLMDGLMGRLCQITNN